MLTTTKQQTTENDQAIIKYLFCVIHDEILRIFIVNILYYSKYLKFILMVLSSC